MMSRLRKHLTLLIILAFTLAAAVPALAAPLAQDGLTPCTGEISGTVVEVDGNTVTIEYLDENDEPAWCTITLAEKSYDHPIVSLLGAVFSDLNIEELEASLQENYEKTWVCALYEDPDETDEVPGTWTYVGPTDENGECEGDAQPVRVTEPGENEGEFLFEGAEGEETLIVEDSTIADDLNGALASLEVMWEADDEGGLSQVGDDILAYHEDGMGFGVLVKLYAMAEESQEACADEAAASSNGENGEDECGVTVDELVSEFNSGTGMGQLFKDHGKPGMVGVGHARKEYKQQQNDAQNDAEPQELENGEQEEQDSGPSLPAQAQGKGKKDKDKVKIKNNDHSNQSAGVCAAGAKSNGKGKGKGLTKCK